MSTPDSPTQQRYSAGSCRLEVTLQLSALSQWYAQPVTEDLSFQLWLQSSEMTLVAQGDRAALQAIADYIQQKIQSTLAIAQLSRSSARSAIATEPLIQPSTLQLSQPLSYLQLCDLSTVLSQYQQATKTLPVTLGPAVASTQSSQSSQDQIISFPLNRRANPLTRLSRSKIWASSAAAAIFAVGLTATLWPNISSPVAQTEADSTLVEPIKPNPASEPKGSASPSGQTLPPIPESGSANRSETSLDNNRSGTATKVEAAPTAPNSNRASDALPRNRAATNEPAPSVAAQGSPAESARSAKAPAADNPPPVNPTVNSPIVRPPIVATEPETAPSLGQSSAPSSDSLADAASAESSENAVAPSAARLSTTDVIAQVQNYFQSQWQAIRADDRQALRSSLVYRLQLSETGEAVSLTALNDQAQAWRDRLFVASDPPTFSAVTANSAQQNSPALVLRLTITADGHVQVSEF